MFDQSFVNEGGARIKPWTVVASFVGQCACLGLMALAPLVYTYQLPLDEWVRNAVLLAPPPPPPPAPPLEPVEARVVPQAPKRFQPVPRAPSAIPDEVALVAEPAEHLGLGRIQAPNVTGLAGDVPGGVPGAVVGTGRSIVRPPAPIRVGGSIQAAKILNRVMPLYPPEAAEEGIGGTVRLEATITSEGLIREMRVLDGHPLLIESAVTATEQWTYRPTLLNGVPVEVITYIDIVFKPAPIEEKDKKKRRKGKKKR